MQPSEEKIINTVVEIMSQRQFYFEEPTHFSLPLHFGYILQVLLLCIFFMGLYFGLKNKFKSRREKKAPIYSLVMEKTKDAQLLAVHPIEKLQAAFLNSLQDRKRVSLRKWKTNTDYVKESENSLLQKICTYYNAAVYGGKEIPIETVSHLSEQVAEWEKQP
jgi:hypothetical protein